MIMTGVRIRWSWIMSLTLTTDGLGSRHYGVHCLASFVCDSGGPLAQAASTLVGETALVLDCANPICDLHTLL